ncbi:MAG: FHA domain-containing protein, partial [Gammaproteobacteria bacterium]|nr:FHA domain-containing protein [Gammaproteobacteria bacterium]
MATMTPPISTLIVQLVHMDGPFKGRMDELADERITLGRETNCHVVFPADLRAVSRLHAEIVRDGARYMLVNHGRNGCLLNGKPADNVYLKVGDIIQLAEGGPKLSFLTSAAPSSQRGSSPQAAAPRPAPSTPPRNEFSANRPAVSPPRATPPIAARPVTPAVAQTASFTLQYGTNIKTFKKSSVSLGREDGVDFVIKHPSVQKKHAELYASG